MIVLRFTIGQTSQDVTSPHASLVVGSDPTADVTLAHPDLAPRALKLTRKDAEVIVELLGTDQRATLRVGDEIELAGVGVALTGLLPTGTVPAFGGYDDDLPATPAATQAATEPQNPAEATPPPLPATESPSATGTPDAQPKTDEAPLPSANTFELADTTTAGAQQPGAGRRSTRKRDERRAAGAAAAAATKRVLTPEERAAKLKPIKFAEPDFGAEMLAQLKRSPFFAVSVGFHLLVFLIISLFATTEPDDTREGPGAIRASMMAEEDELGEEVAEVELDDGLPTETAELPDIDEVELEEPEPPSEKPPPPASPFRSDESLDDEPDPPQIGIMPSLRTTTRKTTPRKPKMPKVNTKKTFTKGAAGQSNQQAADVVRAQLGRGRYGNGATLDDLDENDILVVSGSFDHIERVLDSLRLKYVKLAPWSLVSPKPIDFKGYKIIFWNCGESLGRRKMALVGGRLRRFVQDGGYLFTTDWGVANVLPHAFPGYIKTNGNRAHLPEMVLQIEAAKSARNHPLLEGVFTPGVKGRWWLEQASFDMSVGRADAVTILIECPALRDQFNRSPAVAATFHYGRGRVLHAMGHYYQEAGNIAGTMSVHRLALNFVLMRLNQDRKRAR